MTAIHRVRPLAIAALLTGLWTLAGCGDSAPSSGAQPQAAGPVAAASATPHGEDTATAVEPSPTPTASAAAPATPTAPPERGALLAACADVAAETHYCLTLTDSGPALLGLDSGALCRLVTSDAPTRVINTTSIAWLDDAVYACSLDVGLLRISLRDGTWSAAGLPCEAVTAHRGGLLVSAWAEGDTLRWYPDFAAAATGTPGASYEPVLAASRFTTRGDTLFGAWHSTDLIERADLASGDVLEPIRLEEYDDWILGLAVTDDDHLVVSGPGWGTVVVLFDAVTGTQLRRLYLSAPVSGLACATNVAATPILPTRAPTHTPTPSPTPCHDGNCPSPTLAPPPCESDSWGEPPLGRIADFPPSLPVPSCTGGGTSSNYVRDDVPEAAAELHVVTVYEGQPDPQFLNHRRGRVRVTVQPRPRPIVLSKNAYEPIQWEITVEPGAVLQRIVVQGYGAPILVGVPDGVDVQLITPPCSLAYGWEVSSGGARYRDFIARVRVLTGLTETSFQGCYGGDQFEVPHWLAYPPAERPTPIAGDESLPRDRIIFPGCEAVTAESAYCLATTYDALALIGLDSGQVCPINPPRPLSAFAVSSIAWRGEIAYVCSHSEGLLRIHLPDGDWEPAQVPCAAITDFDGGLLVLTPLVYWTGSPLAAYASYDDIIAGQPQRQYGVGHDFTRMTASGQRLYGAWHATDTLVVVDLESGALLPPLTLDGYDSWIGGLAVHGDRLLVSSLPDQGLLMFDLASGARRPGVPSDARFGAMACTARTSGASELP